MIAAIQTSKSMLAPMLLCGLRKETSGTCHRAISGHDFVFPSSALTCLVLDAFQFEGLGSSNPIGAFVR
jgi:hypothetical protein